MRDTREPARALRWQFREDSDSTDVPGRAGKGRGDPSSRSGWPTTTQLRVMGSLRSSIEKFLVWTEISRRAIITKRGRADKDISEDRQ